MLNPIPHLPTLQGNSGNVSLQILVYHRLGALQRLEFLAYTVLSCYQEIASPTKVHSALIHLASGISNNTCSANVADTAQVWVSKADWVPILLKNTKGALLLQNILCPSKMSKNGYLKLAIQTSADANCWFPVSKLYGYAIGLAFGKAL